MRCDCCNAPLTDVDATAKFAETGNYVNMCGECRKYLPKDLAIITRNDLDRTEKEGEDSDTDWDKEFGFGFEAADDE